VASGYEIRSRIDAENVKGLLLANGGRRSGSLSILPMQLQVGDRYTDKAGEWEVVSRPVSFRGGKSVRA
jgi:hypothetical protein